MLITTVVTWLLAVFYCATFQERQLIRLFLITLSMFVDILWTISGLVTVLNKKWNRKTIWIPFVFTGLTIAMIGISYLVYQYALQE